MANHSHLLFLLPATILLASAINIFKTNSSRFLHERGLAFQWQNGYGAFSVSTSQLDRVTTYIRSQPEFRDNPRGLSVSGYFVEATHDPVSHEEVGQHRVIVGNDAVLEQLQYLASVGIDTTYPSLESMPGPDGRAPGRDMPVLLDVKGLLPGRGPAGRAPGVAAGRGAGAPGRGPAAAGRSYAPPGCPPASPGR